MADPKPVSEAKNWSEIYACNFNVLWLIVMMYYFDNRRHHQPHIHVKYGEQEAVVSIPDGELMEGELRSNKMKLVQAWIEIHQEDLMADWELAINGQEVFKIEPLR